MSLLSIRKLFPERLKFSFVTVLPWMAPLFHPGATAWAAPADPFLAVFVDDRTEAALGPFPYDRARYASAIERLREAGARMVVLKYFLDQPRSREGDEALADEMAQLPVLLQVRFKPDEERPNPFPGKWDRKSLVEGDVSKLMGGNAGWVPLPVFAQNCAGIGFVDLSSKNDLLDVPLVVRYQGLVIPELQLEVVEQALGGKAKFILGREVGLAGHHLPLSQAGSIHLQWESRPEMPSISFLDMWNGNFDPGEVKGKIVILGFDAKETPVLQTPWGPMRIHRFFCGLVESLWRQFLAH